MRFALFLLSTYLVLSCSTTKLSSTAHYYTLDYLRQDGIDTNYRQEDGLSVWEGYGVTKRIRFYEDRIALGIQNNSGSTIKILWDDCSIVRVGLASSVVKSGTKFIDKGQPQKPTTVPDRTEVLENLTPSNSIHYLSYAESVYLKKKEGWNVDPLFPDGDPTIEADRLLAESWEGKDLVLLLAIEINGEKKEFTHTWRVQEVYVKNRYK